MKISELGQLIGAQCIQNEYTDCGIKGVYTGDLLSDILGNADEGCAIVTIQAHRNTIAVASTKDCPVIVVCNDRAVPDDMIAAAKQEHIAVFLTNKNQFLVSGILYEKLGCGIPSAAENGAV
jgi:type III secretion system FlhB-like substrate exporter